MYPARGGLVWGQMRDICYLKSTPPRGVCIILVSFHFMMLIMQEVKRVMEKTLSDLQIPMDIAEECLLQREKRTDIDQTHDEVEKCLSKVRSNPVTNLISWALHTILDPLASGRIT